MWSSAFLNDDFVYKQDDTQMKAVIPKKYPFPNTGEGWFETHLGCSSNDFISKLEKMREHEEMAHEVDLIMRDVEILKSLETEATIASLSWSDGNFDVIKSLSSDEDMVNLRKFGESRKVSLIQACNQWKDADTALKMLDEFEHVWGEEERNAWALAMTSKSDAKQMWKSSLHQITRLTQKERDTLEKASDILEKEGSLSSRLLQERMMEESIIHKSMTPPKLGKLLSMYGEEFDIVSGSKRGSFVKMDKTGLIIKDPWVYAADFLDSDGVVTITERGEPKVTFVSKGVRGKAHCEELHKAIGCGSLQISKSTNTHRIVFFTEDDIVKLLEGVLPHLSDKKDSVNSLLQFIKSHDYEERETIKRDMGHANREGDA